MVQVFQERCSHGVPLHSELRMFRRWEAHPIPPPASSIALLFIPPHLDDDQTQRWHALQKTTGTQRSSGGGGGGGGGDGGQRPTPRSARSKQVHYSGVFLTSQSRTDLLERVPPVHDVLHAGHITLAFKPSAQHIAGLPVGRRVAIRIDGAAANSGVQAVSVTLLEMDADGRLGGNIDVRRLEGGNRFPHITLSRTEATPAKESNTLITECHGTGGGVPPLSPGPPLILEGIVGLKYKGSGMYGGFEGADVTAREDDGYDSYVDDEDNDGGDRGKGRHLLVFDFDETLVHSPEQREYEATTGRDWAGRGWFSSKESLDDWWEPRLGPAANAYVSRYGVGGEGEGQWPDNTLVVILTGRVETLRGEWRERRE